MEQLESWEGALQDPRRELKIKKKDMQQKVIDMEAKILKVMLAYHEDGKHDGKVDDVASDLGLHSRSKMFRERWSDLKKRGLLGNSKSGSGVVLTKLGLEEAATPEYKAMMKDLAIIPKTNKEHQEKIKKYFKKKKSGQIFDFLLKYGPLSKGQLSALVEQNPRSHGFHYSFNELRDKGYLEEHSNGKGKIKTFQLSDKAFKSKDDRPKECDIDMNDLKNEVSKGKAKIESQRHGQRSDSKRSVKKVKSMNKEQVNNIKPKEVENNAKEAPEVVSVVSADGESDPEVDAAAVAVTE